MLVVYNADGARVLLHISNLNSYFGKPVLLPEDVEGLLVTNGVFKAAKGVGAEEQKGSSFAFPAPSGKPFESRGRAKELKEALEIYEKREVP